jgi:hypothetical protein
MTDKVLRFCHRDRWYGSPRLSELLEDEENIDIPDGEESRLQSCCNVILSISPDKAPLPWACINSFCFLWSTLLIAAILRTAGPLERIYGTVLYLTWNLVTTVIWCIEIGLIILYRRRRSTLIHWIELIAAVYFFQDSIRLMQMIRDREADNDVRGELLDAVINVGAYLYQLLDSLYLVMNQKQLLSHRSSVDAHASVESLSDALMRQGLAEGDDDAYQSIEKSSSYQAARSATV